jgi:uncharacterized membrane protein YfcA
MLPEGSLGAIEIASLVGVAFVAGFVDAIAGGGGLITVPALLATGLSPHLVLGTNKGQSMFGTAAALTRYARAGLLEKKPAVRLFLLGFCGACLGTTIAVWLRPEVLRPVVLALLFAVTPLVFVRPKASQLSPRLMRIGPVALALVIGAYDGFFGPGTGTLLLLGFVALGSSLLNASAEAKVVNLASNLAAFTVFALKGFVLFKVALPMGLAQLTGGHLGARAALRGGDRIVRGVLVVVVLALLVKLGHDTWAARG